MSLIKCKKCGKEYSVIKDNCPYCGQSQKEPPASTAQHTPAKKKKELYILPPDERKSPILAAIFSFLFWWIALDTFYLYGLLVGFCKLLLIYFFLPIFWCWYFLDFFRESTTTKGGDALLALFVYVCCLELISIIKAIYYIALPINKFNRKYNSYTA